MFSHDHRQYLTWKSLVEQIKMYCFEIYWHTAEKEKSIEQKRLVFD